MERRLEHDDSDEEREKKKRKVNLLQAVIQVINLCDLDSQSSKPRTKKHTVNRIS
jgi:hypothetical protein